ncbi:MAG: glutamine--fructose-6-phosphate transaminase (isomerizing) [Candidatus Wildermuthbacteria bacterium]|nr:glutamine--fructose-6-phosphate transaminase (isomerizing) [Candidatus Wildermuthbacteria bacterium]
MCGIVGYIGKQKNIKIGLDALKRLEYRGYDSAGMAVYNQEKKRVDLVRSVGRVANLEAKLEGMGLEGSPFLFYTRWATHGAATEENCHPHRDCKDSMFVVHNGIIENYLELKERLVANGHEFRSETDTEVIPHLLEEFFTGNLEEAVRKVVPLLRGAFALAVISRDDPQKLVAVRFSAPLLIGVAEGEYLVASDPSAVVTHTDKVIYLEDREIAVLTPLGFAIEDFSRRAIEKAMSTIDWNVQDAQKGGYEHFMLKEIMEHPESITNALRGRLNTEEGLALLGGLDAHKETMRGMERVQVLACGSAYLVGRAGEYMLEECAGMPVEVDTASEFRYRKQAFDSKTLSVFISQSGETADTIAALKEVKEKGGFALGVVNVVGSTVARGVDAGVYAHSGPEIAVAATKSITGQLAVMALLSLFLGRQRQMSLDAGKQIARELASLPDLAKKILETGEHIRGIAEKYKTCRNFFVIGRKYSLPVAFEGALKLKEVAYVHAEAFGGGELKHGSLALIDEGFPTIAVVPSDSVYEKMISNIQEIRARKGPVIAIATEGNDAIGQFADDVMYIPKTLEMLSPVLSVIPLQLFAYYAGVLRGCDVDKPKNIAKSVTVE